MDHNIPSTQYIGDHIKFDPKTIYEDIYVNGVLSLNPECHKYFMIELWRLCIQNCTKPFSKARNAEGSMPFVVKSFVITA